MEKKKIYLQIAYLQMNCFYDLILAGTNFPAEKVSQSLQKMFVTEDARADFCVESKRKYY